MKNILSVLSITLAHIWDIFPDISKLKTATWSPETCEQARYISMFVFQRESQGTVYFSEDLEDAQEAVNGTLIEYKQLLDKLSDTQRQEVISTLGLRMEELKAQQKAIEDELIEDH